MASVAVRIAEVQDAESYRSFMSHLFEEDLDTLIPRESTPTVEAVKKYVAEHDGIRSALFLAELSGNLVGTSNFTRLDRPNVDHTARVGVSVAAHFRRKGIGRALMGAGLDWAKKAPGLWRLELEVMENNTEAISLYEGLGFRREGVKRHAVRKACGPVNLILMALLLESA